MAPPQPPSPAKALASRDAFEDALAYFEAQQPVLKDVWDALSDAAREQAITVAGVTQIEVIQQVLVALETAVAEGTTIEDFAATVSASLESAWGGTVASPAFRIETIFRTNTQVAYAAGRYQVATHPDIVSVRPQWMFSAVLDSRTSPMCRPLDGLIRPADSGFWNGRHPPLHHRCRSSIITLRNDQAKDMGGAHDIPEHDLAASGFGGIPKLDWAPEPAAFLPELQSALP